MSANQLIRIKRVYQVASSDDGVRLLVDRLWPRGVTKARAALGRWEKGLAPSADLRKWFSHDPAKWTEFEARYRKELTLLGPELQIIAEESARGTVTLVYAAQDELHNEAVVLKRVLDELASRT